VNRKVLFWSLFGFLFLDFDEDFGNIRFKETLMAENRIPLSEENFNFIPLEDIRQPILTSVDGDGHTEIRRKGQFTAILASSSQPPLYEGFPFGTLREGFVRSWYTMKQIPNPSYFKNETPAGEKIVTNEWECVDREVFKK
jgi:hypothetical protein